MRHQGIDVLGEGDPIWSGDVRSGRAISEGVNGNRVVDRFLEEMFVVGGDLQGAPSGFVSDQRLSPGLNAEGMAAETYCNRVIKGVSQLASGSGRSCRALTCAVIGSVSRVRGRVIAKGID